MFTQNANRKKTNMKKALAFSALAIVVLLALPSSAQAGYYAGTNVYHIDLYKYATVKPPTQPIGAVATGVVAPMRTVGQGQYADGPNLYQYVRSNPTNYVDPDGREAKKRTRIYHIRGWPKGSARKGGIFGTKRYRHTVISFTGNAGDGVGADFGPEPPYRDNILEKCGGWNIFSKNWGCPGMSRGSRSEIVIRLDANRPYGKKELVRYTRSWKKLKHQGKDIPCRCATHEQIKSCIKEFSKKWEHKRFHVIWRNCMDFAEQAEKPCCLKPGPRHIGWTTKNN